ncbi:MAG: tyrosine-type recombinase/integrase [Chloroflexota bacterium]
MNFVDPIRDRKKIAQIKNLLRGEKRFRDLLLFTVGINSALRVSDLLILQIGQFVDENGARADRFWLREEKRGKRQDVIVNDSIKEALDEYVAAYPVAAAKPDHYLFFNTRTMDYSQPISRERAWKFVTEICAAVGLRGNFGTHTLRKTWGYHARQNGVELALIMHKLNHNNLAYTKRYLGITDDELEAVVRRLNL